MEGLVVGRALHSHGDAHASGVVVVFPHLTGGHTGRGSREAPYKGRRMGGSGLLWTIKGGALEKHPNHSTIYQMSFRVSIQDKLPGSIKVS